MSGGIEYGGAVPLNWAHRTPIARKSADRLALGGYATRFNKPHPYRGGIDVFRPGAFAKSLLTGSEVRLLENHDESKCLAVTGDTLRIWADDVGLSFKVNLPGTLAAARIYEDVKSGRRAVDWL